ncbi:MAG: histidine phosphatase family protein [Elainellaceae cyanobacterium]
MPLKLYLLRHGETEQSRTGGFCGALDPALTAEGMEMAQAFADQYDSIPWDAVFVSPMKRTLATAEPLCKATGIEPQIRDGLKEIAFGEWEGQSLETVKANYPQAYERWLTEPAWNPPTAGETAVQVASRASLVVAEIESKYPDGHVLIVSHKATIRIILCNLLGIDVGRYRDRITTLVASVSIVRFATYGPMLEILGDRHHLPEALRSRPGT